MKKAMKKFLIILSCCLIGCGVSAAAGCTKKVTNPSGPVQTAEIGFSVTEKTLTIGDEEYLTPTYKRLSGYTLTYATSDPSIVQVDQNGKISAEGEGTAIVKAIYSNGTSKAEASVSVTSTFGGYLPELKTMGVTNDVSIAYGGSYVMSPYISFHGKRFDDMIVTYSVDNDAVAEVSKDGEIVAKAKGETTLVVEAAWRGKDQTNTPTLQKQINLSVIDDVRFYNGERSVADESLFVLGEFEGVSYRNTMPCDFTAWVNGAELPVSVTIEDESIVARQGELLVAAGFGSTSVTLSAEDGEGTYTTSFSVGVERIEKTVEGTVPLFSILDGTYLDETTGQKKTVLSWIGESDEALDAYQGTRALTVSGGKIYGVESSSDGDRGAANVKIGTDKIVYSFRMETLMKTISEAEDLRALELSDGKILNGYYELMCDVNAAGTTLRHSTGAGACFSGTFNGNGFTIRNLRVESSGMFGVFSASATVKNTAFIDLNATEAYFLAGNTLGDGVTMTDLYISLSEDTVTPRGITGRTAERSVMKNVVLEYLGENAQANRTYSGDGWEWQGLIGGVWRYESGGKYYARDNNWSDVYVVSPFVVSFHPQDYTVNGVKNAAVYGYGANETLDIYDNSLESAEHIRPNPELGTNFYTETYADFLFTNLYHYSSYDDLSAEEKDFSHFSSEYWAVYENKIVWKSVLEQNVEVGLYDGDRLVTNGIRTVNTDQTYTPKAYVFGNRITSIEVSVSENDYLEWNAAQGTFRVKALVPKAELVTVEITFTVTVGEARFVKTLSLTLKPSDVDPIQSGGNYAASDYDGPKVVEPIQSGGNYETVGDYDGPKLAEPIQSGGNYVASDYDAEDAEDDGEKDVEQGE